MDKYTLTLTDSQLVELGSMVYSAWCSAFDADKKAKAATWEENKQVCPKADWLSFHEAQLIHAKKNLDKYTDLKNAVCPMASQILFKANPI